MRGFGKMKMYTLYRNSGESIPILFKTHSEAWEYIENKSKFNDCEIVEVISK